MKPRKPLKKVSDKRVGEMRVYAKRKKVFLKCHSHCEICWTWTPLDKRELHHKRGRAGSLYLDERFWLMLCPECHREVHNFPRQAIEAGYLAGAGEWNVPMPL